MRRADVSGPVAQGDRRHASAPWPVLPIETTMLDELKSLGYAEVTLQEDSLWGPCGTMFRGHEFHYSEIAEPLAADSGWRTVYSVAQRSGEPAKLEGFQKKARAGQLCAWPFCLATTLDRGFPEELRRPAMKLVRIAAGVLIALAVVDTLACLIGWFRPIPRLALSRSGPYRASFPFRPARPRCCSCSARESRWSA